MTPLQQFNELKGEVADLERELARSEGAGESLLKSLQSEHQIRSLDEAKGLIVIKQKELDELKKKYDLALEEYRNERAKRMAE